MTDELIDLEKVINSGLSTGVKSSSIDFNQLTIEIEIENINKTILFLKTNEKSKFRQLTEIKNIQNLELSNKDYLFHAGTKFENNKWLSNGGRVLNFTHTGEDLTKIRANIHKMINQISWEEGYYRKDIGWRYIDD